MNEPVAAHFSWLSESTRLTVFREAIDVDSLGQWWAQFVGHPVERDEAKPMEGFRRIEGEMPGLHEQRARLSLAAQVGRVDWHMRAKDVTPLALPAIGPFPGVVEQFIELGRKWIAEASIETRRIALGAILVLPVESREEGYSRMSSLLRIDLPTDASDFTFRINRPVASKVLDDLTLNRLMTWGIVQLSALSLDGSGEIPGSRTLACRLEMDISTQAGREEALPLAAEGPIFDELWNIAKEIAAEGYPE
jgi:hypothetical protein